MTQNQRKKFSIAVYLSIASIAIAMAVIGSIYFQNTPRDFAINLSTDLICVALLFFIVNQFFGLNTEEELHEKIKVLLNGIERKQSVLIDSYEVRQRLPLHRFFAYAKRIDLLGYSLSNLLYRYRKVLIERIQDGANVRILIIDPSTQACNIIKENTKYYTFESDYKLGLTHIGQVRDSITRMNSKPKGNFEVKMTSWIPSCTIVIIDSDTMAGKMTVAINSPSNMTPEDRPHLILEKRENSHWFDYCVNEFEGLWEGAHECNYNELENI